MNSARNNLLRALPDPIVFRILDARLGREDMSIPPIVDVAAARSRLLVAPANYAGQGHAWATAASRLDDVSAANLEVTRAGGYRFAAAANAAAVEQRLTHVLVEAQRPILGRRCGHDVRREAQWLDEHGLARAYVSHGSDLRLPSRHAELDRWSPFRDADWDLVPVLEESARENSAFLAEQARPVFVSTPDLLLDAPDAEWLPVGIDAAKWSVAAPPLSSSRPVVFHAPTNARSKGTLLITPALEELDASGVISYGPGGGIPSANMPGLVMGADIVLDQFRLGSYGVAACEGMAAGRIVLGHVSDQVRAVAADAAGMPLPIVEADPDSIGHVLRDIVADPDRYRDIAATGPEFVAKVHDGTYAGRVISSFLR